MTFLEIIAEVQNLTEDEKRQLLDLLERQLSESTNEENPEFLAMLESRVRAADNGGRAYTLAHAREALKKSVRRPGR